MTDYRDEDDMAAAVHSHHWVIDTPNGPTSFGQCRVCGASKQFANSEDAIQERAVGPAKFGRIGESQLFARRSTETYADSFYERLNKPRG